ncbi:orotidine-5'-phosphate decarboxylase [Pseudodesulfovibrio piezophilus]|uniref:Orotidine 5'-phosphate decarboxylase n=1 Tax=Pseudodesulfovibrio piezophilus (strain DSM 21447 / JCM 15486 / C1TLV30) TaxID=1322246 RepID=M1WUB1_PSEP2|nr:orotidine-5'-phosphate decarboxylase [Pseudodesulfovibrio piezophilus]CCH50477.1 Orotidine 5'-phosphate decarboxylase [Pseudodesulfovibrio piezophilus C1TLV30]
MAELVVALDFKDSEAALNMARQLRGTAKWMKVGLELFTAEGPSVVRGLKGMDFKVFLDLKFFDIPNTVRGAVRSAARLGVDIVSIHALGGERMAQAAMEGSREGASLRSNGPGDPPRVLAITMLTSMAAGDLPVDGAPEPSQMALDLAVKAEQYGLNGVVCSGLEAERIKKACGKDFLCLTPGIRPSGSSSDDQRRVVTPAQAVLNGSDFLVMGRPITNAASPRDVAQAVCEEMLSL